MSLFAIDDLHIHFQLEMKAPGQVIYAHCHGEHRFHDSIEGRHHGIMYRLVSGDYLKWVPLRIL